MGTFFRGWRRKVGCATLSLAVVILGIWLRTFKCVDFIYFYPQSGRCIELLVCPQGVWWERREWKVRSTEVEKPERMFHWQTWRDEGFGKTPYHGYGPFHSPMINWRWQSAGFDFGEFDWKDHPFGPSGFDRDAWKRTTTYHVNVWLIPFWSVILALTLPSAYLLLSRTHPKQNRVNPA